MITAINAKNNDSYKALFEQASHILSGYQSVQTYDKARTQYWYKDSDSKKYKDLTLTDIEDFADALVQYDKLFIPTEKGPIDGFSSVLGITSLEEYYNWLPELKVGKDEKPTIFTKLPLDEPHFEINANTRAITIPNDFKKNGIGVQGDDLAEVVYFTIDRFFDAIDLNNTEIYIEWETPKSKATGQVAKGVSEPYLQIIDKVVEDDEQKDKLVFGWAISEAITKDSGTLKFAVRFLQRNSEKKIVYSLSTLTAQVTIHPNLGTDIMAAIPNADNCNGRLLERIQESEIIGGAQAQAPYFLQNLVVIDDGYDIKTTEELQVVATSDDTGRVSYIWKRSDLDTNNNSDDTWFEITDEKAYGEKMVKLTEEELEAYEWKLPENHIYHIGTDENNTKELGLDKYNLKLAFADENNDGKLDIPDIYEKRAYLIVNKYGKYRAEARNRIFNSLTKTNSNIVTYKRPDAIVMLDGETVENHILGKESATLNPQYQVASGDHTYQWYRSEEKNILSSKINYSGLPEGGAVSYGKDFIRILVPSDSSKYFLQDVGPDGDNNSFYIPMKVYAPEGAAFIRRGQCGLNPESEMPIVDDEMIDITNPEVGGIDSQGRKYYLRWDPIAAYNNGTWDIWTNNKGENEYIGWKYEFIWYDANGVEIERIFVKTQLANSTNFNAVENFQEVPNATSQKFKAIEPGIYQLKIVRSKNNAKTSATSIEYRVTNAPETPKLGIGIYTEQEQIGIDTLLSSDENGLEFAWIAPEHNDGFEVEWYLSRELVEKDDLLIYRHSVEKDVTKSIFNPTKDMFVETFKDANEDIDGLYYAIVRTKLNGVVSEEWTDKPDTKVMYQVID